MAGRCLQAIMTGGVPPVINGLLVEPSAAFFPVFGGVGRSGMIPLVGDVCCSVPVLVLPPDPFVAVVVLAVAVAPLETLLGLDFLDPIQTRQSSRASHRNRLLVSPQHLAGPAK